MGVTFAGTCGVSAPRITLSELHSGCDADSKSRHPDCAAAMHRFCQRVTYPSPITTFGLPRENADSKIHMSCVRSYWSGNVSLAVLQQHYLYCRIYQSQQRNCIHAAENFCKQRLGSQFAGVVQELYSDENLMHVHCFRSPRIEFVPLNVLQDHLDSCQFPHTESAPCFAAAHRWCAQFGYDGGITMSSNSRAAFVACYNAEFNNIEFVERTSEFYSFERQVSSVCSVDFDVDQGQILSQTPEFLKTETYDNRGSSVPLTTSFHVEKSLVETNSFTHSHSFTFGTSSTVFIRIPFFGGADITVSSSFQQSVSLTNANSKEVSYSTTSDVDVPPGKGIMKEAVVNKATLNVPWSASIVNGLGVAHTISGEWHGVNTYNFRVIQTDIGGLSPCGMNDTISE